MILSLRFAILVAALLWLPRLLAAQHLDPSFQVASIYKSGEVRQVIQQPDGKTLLLGSFARVAHQQAPSCGLVRLLANSNQPDPVFLQNISALSGPIRQFLLLANGKILVTGGNSLSATLQSGAVSRQALLLLNADGTPDAAFDAGAGPNAYVMQMLEQPDGKLLLCGGFTRFNGLVVSVFVRLNPNGAVDMAFQAAAPVIPPFTTGTLPTPVGYCLALQADGRILVGGSLEGNIPQQPVWGYSHIVRLLATGRLDSTFQSARATLLADVYGMAVQPNGRILAVDGFGNLMRLLPATGAMDAMLLPQYGLGSYTTYDGNWMPGAPLVQIQPGTGRIIVKTHAKATATVPGSVVAFTPTGTLDAAFNNAAAGGSSGPYWVHVLANGQLLLGGQLLNYGAAAAPRAPLALLTATGQRANSLPTPLLQTEGSVSALALQPDGKILVGGDFTEINGLAVPGGLARLQPNGLPDSLYSVAAAPSEGLVTTLALQADGKLLVGGSFPAIGGGSRPMLARLLGSGQLDASYQPAFSVTPFNYFPIFQLLVQADGKLLVASSGTDWGQSGGNNYQGLVRLLANGQLDTSFQPSGYGAQGLLLQPDGKILASGRLNAPDITLWRWLPNGTLDPSFTHLAYSAQRPTTTILAQDGQGRIIYQYPTYAAGVGYQSALGRIDATGQADGTFAASLGSQYISKLVVQPNQRLLAGINALAGGLSFAGTTRLLSDGSLDASYQAANGPNTNVSSLLIQPDGAMLMAGRFTAVSGLPTSGLARLIDANVLAVAARQPEIPTAAWPVPAHDVLRLRLTATAHPQRVSVLDALGKTVLAQPVKQAEMTLNTSALAPGIYLLSIVYSSGTVTRRIIVE